jgi:hypothetical protein
MEGEKMGVGTLERKVSGQSTGKSNVDLDKTEAAFAVEVSTNAFEIKFGGQTIARGDSDFGFQNLCDLVLHPDGEALISYQQLAPTCFGRVATAPTVRRTADSAEVMLDAESSNGAMRTHCVANVSLSADGKSFEWEFVHETRVLRTIPYPERFFSRTDADPEFADTGAWIFEFSDPMPHRAFGPKDGPIPLDRPDILFPQPWFRKDGWQRNWTHFVFARADGKIIKIPMNHLENHDKDFWRQSPDGFVAFLGGKGTNLRYRFLDGTGRNVCHHYCMWGYDIHFWQIFAPGSGGSPNERPELPEGFVFKHRYVLESMSDEEASNLLQNAEDHPWRQGDQRSLDNTPVYVPGVTEFHESLKREDDRGFFQPALTADFLPEHPGRKTPGCVRLDNHGFAYDRDGNSVAQYNAWAISLGSDNWHTPIEPGAKYEISAWVKLEADEKAVARIAANYVVQYDQAKPTFRTETSKTFFSNEVRGKTGWVKLQLLTPEMPEEYICTMNVRMELIGRGLAYFDEFEFKCAD